MKPDWVMTVRGVKERRRGTRSLAAEWRKEQRYKEGPSNILPLQHPVSIILLDISKDS
jgi:hypothetical protein